MAMLEVKNLGISFGGLRAVNGFNITIQEGELYGLIGPRRRSGMLHNNFPHLNHSEMLR